MTMASLASLLPVLETAPARDVEGVLQIMDGIEQALAPGGVLTDGIGWFNRLYRTVTQAVVQAVKSNVFDNGPYILALDVEFANLYFSALGAFVRDDRSPRVPRAWWPVFVGHERTDVFPIQFALAGMNAHINRDLPVALTSVWNATTLKLPDRAEQKVDYERVNHVLTAVEKEVKEWFLTGPWAVADETLNGLDDVIAMFSVVEAREAAWAQGEALHALNGPDGVVGGKYLEALDGMVGLAGRGLLHSTR